MIQDGYSYCKNAWILDERIKNELNILLIISSLCAKTGETFASNKFFADLFNCTEVSISSKIRKLIDLGYIEAEYKKRGCEVKSRKLRLKSFLIDDSKNFYSTVKKNFKDNNNINIKNNINNNINNNTILMNSNIREAMEKWLAYKKEMKKTYKPIGLKECITKLEKLSGNNPNIAMKIVNESISNGWTGLFPLKEKQMSIEDDEDSRLSSKELLKKWGLKDE